jgi:hypothetical protein
MNSERWKRLMVVVGDPFARQQPVLHPNDRIENGVRITSRIAITE